VRGARERAAANQTRTRDEHVVLIVQRLVRHLACSEPDARDDAIEQCIGPPLREALLGLLNDPPAADRALAAFRTEYGRAGLLENQLYDGLADTLEMLQQSGVTMFVATSKPQEFAERTIDHFGLKRFFRAIYGCGFDGSLAEKAELLRHLIATEKLDPDDTFMIGDRKYDILAARENGVRSIAVTWGFGSDEELRNARPDAFCSSPAELVSVVFEQSRSRRRANRSLK